MMLKTRYREQPESWKPGSGRHWMLASHSSEPESVLPHWSFAVFKNKEWGTQSKLSDKTAKAGACDGLLFAKLFDNPALLEIKTWWTVSQTILTREFEATAERKGRFYWTPAARKDNSGKAFVKQIWGELNAYQSRFGAFVNGRHIAFVLRTRRNELTFSDFIEWEDREVYTAFLGFSMAAIDVVLSGPSAQYAERLRDIINLLCPREDRKINVDGQDHPDDDNDDDAGEELF
ncbi:hypothetical protein BV25DRAFT_968898 [Artomyces pyxidatus]|uniref:Uncharacterized protein n=1 Tax=Artomyces pyxidatus TaxID=48021 RepID=A0ACB8SVM7_9AGAM|nr:hypothetical protein BV25DRAFT_968898 [Artomyces pyxidatus]